MTFKSFIALSIVFSLTNLGISQAIIDGTRSEWSNATLIVDDAGDVSGNQLDLLNVHMTDDKDFLYIMVETNREWNLDEDEELTLYIDADNNPNTGFSTQGLGTELTYYFSERFGFSELAGTVNHAGLDLFIAPTVSSQWYEFALSKDSPSLNLNQSSIIRCVIDNGNSNDQIGPFDYTMQSNQTSNLDFSFDKVSAADFRIVSYNVKFDGWFESETEDDQRNLIESLNPDIIAFQEIYDHSTSEIENSLDQILPSSTGWNAIHNWSDVYVFTTHAVIGTDAIDGNEISLLDIDGKPLIVVNVHFPCCDNDQDRQQEIDRLLSVIRDRNTNGTLSFDFDQDTPLIIAGDYNLVGDGQQYKSLITGDIVFNSTFGPDVVLDGDGSGLTDANLLQPHLPSNHTWYNQFSSFAPGKLDLFIYSDYSLSLENGFVMNTAGISNLILQDYNLTSQSTVRASDHMPIVADFKFKVTVDTEEFAKSEITIMPNPARDYLTIDLGGLEQVASLSMLDMNGKYLINNSQPNQRFINIDVSLLLNGYYIIQVITQNQTVIKPIVVQH